MVKEPEEDRKVKHESILFHVQYIYRKQTGSNQLIIHIVLCVKNPGACMAMIQSLVDVKSKEA